MPIEQTTRSDSVGQGSKLKSYSAMMRRIMDLRREVIAYDAETAKLKQAAERADGPVARFAVDRARSPKFHDLSNELIQAEVDLAGWKSPAKKRKPDALFSSMVKLAIGRVR